MRHELKCRLNAAEAAALRTRLRAVMTPDPHALPGGTYAIHSVYFDTPTDRALMEKQVGVVRRDKYRIRYYNDDTAFFRLERKSKHGSLCDKAGCSLNRDETERILRGDTGWMLTDDRRLLRELYLRMTTQRLLPRVQVHYIREPYLYIPGNVRVTLDSDIRTGLMSADFLSPGQPRPPTQSPDFVLMEVKFDNFLPGIIAAIVRCNARPMSFSKFEACHTYD